VISPTLSKSTPTIAAIILIPIIYVDLKKLSQRANKLLDRLEKFLPYEQPEPDWQAAYAFRWRKYNNTYHAGGYIQAIHHPHPITLNAGSINALKILLISNGIIRARILRLISGKYLVSCTSPRELISVGRYLFL
jgi:hypothetical protein